MKSRIIAIILILSLFVTITGCQNDNDSSKTKEYIISAQKHLDQGDYASAIEILKKGYRRTKDPDIAVMLAEVQDEYDIVDSTSKEATNEPIQLDDYVGGWTESGYTPGNGLTLTVRKSQNDVYEIYVSYTMGETGRIADVCISCKLNKETNTVSESYDNDGWGNTGDITLIFENKKIQLDHTVTSRDAYSRCSIPEGTFTFEEHYPDGLPEIDLPAPEYSPTYEPSTSPQPSYDLSKASGILANSGLTEQQFRDMCVPLCDNYTYGIKELDTLAIQVGRQYHAENPGDKMLALHTERYLENPDNYPDYSSLEECLNSLVYIHKGRSILTSDSYDYIKLLQENPSQYIGQPFVLYSFTIDSAGGDVYTDNYFLNTEAVLYDRRDDVHSPNILNRERYIFYVIFEGTYQTGNNIGLYFSLLSLDKATIQ